MTGAVHTPGPWECQPAEDDGSVFIIGANLGGLVGAAHCWPTEVDAGGSDRVLANARLIAAAPELLEALKEALSLMRGEPDMSLPGSDHWLWAESASAAIAIAEGERA